MAERREDVLIYLRTIGAAQARRDIDKVTDSLERLDKKTGANTGATDSNTKSVDKNADANEGLTKKRDLNTRSAEKNTSSVKDMSSGYDKLDRILTKHERTMDKVNRTIKQMASNEERIRKVNLGNQKSYYEKLLRNEKSHNKLMDKERQRAFKASERMAKKNASLMARLSRGGGGGGRGGGGGFRFPEARRPGRIAMVGGAIGLAMDVIPVLGTALNSLAAGALAAANGLGPILGLVGTIPAGMLAATQGVGFLVAAFGGLGGAIGGDAEALAKLGPNTRAFVNEIIRLKDPMRGLRATAQESLFYGLKDEINDLAEIYLPKLNQAFYQNGRDINNSMRKFSTWMTSGEGQGVTSGILENNNALINIWAQTGEQLLQIFMRIAKAAGPTLIKMSEDFLGFMAGINAKIGDGEALEAFFGKAYDTFKSAFRVLGNFGAGVYNIIKLADPLTDHLGEWITDLSERFRKWTESGGGQESITQYFKDMKEPLDAVLRLAGALGKGLFDISRSPIAAKILDSIATSIPRIVEIFKSMDGSYIDGLLKFIEGVEKLAEGGALKSIGEAIEMLAGAFTIAVDFFNKIPPEIRDLLIKGLVFTTLFGGLANDFIAWATKIILGMSGGGLGGRGGGNAAAAAGAGAAASRASQIARGVGSIAAGVGISALIAGGAAAAWEANRTKGTGMSGADLTKAVKGQNWYSIFGKDIPVGAGSYDETGTVGSLKRFGNDKGFTATINDAVEGSFLGDAFRTVTGLFGQDIKTSRNIELEKWQEIDAVLGALPLEEAALKFEQLKLFSEQAETPMETLVNELLPGYRDRVKGLMNAQGEVNVGLDQLIANMGAGADQFIMKAQEFQTKMAQIAAVQTQYNSRQDPTNPNFDPSAQFIIPSFNYAGGLVGAGTSSFVGELGPEMGIDRAGNMSLLGIGGAQLIRPGSDMAILPSSGTFDPFGGNMGNAPSWAVDAFRNAVSPSDYNLAADLPRAQGDGGGTTQQFSFDVSVTTTGAGESEVYEAMVKAWQKFEKDRKERSI